MDKSDILNRIGKVAVIAEPKHGVYPVKFNEVDFTLRFSEGVAFASINSNSSISFDDVKVVSSDESDALMFAIKGYGSGIISSYGEAL